MRFEAFRQTEASECGLACLAAASANLGAETDMVALRQRYTVSMRGLTFYDLVEIAADMRLSGRAVQCDLEELKDLQIPAILHWGMNHFVLLLRLRAGGAEIFDPAAGERKVDRRELERRFTGVALEVRPAESFKPRRLKSPLSLWSMVKFDGAVKGGLAQAVALSLVMQLYVLAGPFYQRLAIDQAALKGDMDLLWVLAGGFALFAAFNGVADLLRGVILQRLSSLVSWDLSRRVFARLIRLPLPWFQKRKLADVLTRFQALDPIRNLVSNGIIAVALDGALSVTTFVMMMMIAPLLGLIVLGAAVVLVTLKIATLPLALRFGADAMHAAIEEQGKRLETIRAIQTVKMMGAEARREADWANRFVGQLRANQSSALVNVTTQVSHRTLEALFLVAIIYVAAQSLMAGAMTVGSIVAFLSYRAQFMMRVQSVAEQVVAWRMLDVYTHRLADIVLTEPEEISGELGSSFEMRGAIELRNVSYRYSEREPFVLKDLSVTFPAGGFVAVTGPSGVGKSTLMKIMAGLYQPVGGQVLIDGLPLQAWGLGRVRKSLGVVMQDDELLSGTIAENVAFFDPKIDLDRVWSCLTLASIAMEIRALPMGLHTLIGDVGATLSGGQKQRVILARALYRQPTILLLDEATSHLDMAREESINAALKDLSITRVVIAHRKETIAAAEVVMKLNNDGIHIV